MSITDNQTASVVAGGQSVSLSTMFNLTAGASNPAYVVLSALDRNEYTALSTGATGSLSGNGQTMGLASVGGDFRTAGIVFTYSASTGQYTNATYGNLSQMTYTASASANDLTSLSLYGYSSGLAAAASAYATSPSSLMQTGQYLGSADVATQPAFAGPVPAQATPDSLAAVAATFVGEAWNKDGCWVLANTIASEAGAALPVQSTAVGMQGTANGEWGVAYNGPLDQPGNWQSMVKEGDIVVIGNNSGLGHITTCVSGSGATAELIDNIQYINPNGTTWNPANDGSADDVSIAAPHLASGEFTGNNAPLAQDVVIYRLDTPVVSETAASVSTACGLTVALSPILSAADPFGKAVTEYQVYDTAAGDSLTVASATVSAHTAATADTVASLASVGLTGGSAAGADTVEVRAYNGSYWGDWTGLNVTVNALSAPVLAQQTAGQTWLQGSKVSFALPAGTFTDPQGETLTRSATLASGAALPAWLSFNAATGTFSGTVPAGMQALSLKVTATDTSGLSVSETFTATVPAAAPTLVHQTAAQTFTEGSAVSLAIAANTFADPQGETLTYTATLASGAALPNGLSLDSATDILSGTAPYGTAPLSIKVTATDTSGLSVSETFAAALVAPPPAVTAQTAAQSWTAGQAVTLALPANTFTAAQGQTMTYRAALSSGAALPGGLTFNAATDTFGGTAPLTPGAYTLKVTATETNGMSASETFTATVAAASAPVLAAQTAAQTWTANKAVSLAIPGGAFTDPQGETLTYKATLASGAALSAGLTFNAATDTFGGTAPVTPQTLALKVTATDTAGLSVSETFNAVVSAAAPTMTQTAAQAWTANKAVSLAAAGTFADPQGEALTYKATLASGAALPTGLTFNAATDTFGGTAPVTPQTLALKVTATDTSGLSTSETFNAVVTAAAPTLATQTAAQAWTAGKAVSLAIPGGAFVDPQGEALSYKATLASGAALPTGLTFNAATDTFGGTAPAVPGTLALKVTATDTSGLSVSDSFNAVVAAGAPTISASTGNQLWTDGQKMSFLLPANTFSDPQGSKMTYAAAEVGGTDQTSWLHFTPSTGDFFGTVPSAGSGTIGIMVTATNAYGLTSSETFGMTFAAGGSHVTASSYAGAHNEMLVIHSS